MSTDNLMNQFPSAPETQVTLANWRRPPFNRWSFMHVRELIPSARIRSGTGRSRRFQSKPRDLLSIEFTTSEEKRTTVGAFLDATQCDGFMVLSHGCAIAERYFNRLEPHRPHILMSVSKSLSATLAGVYVSAGHLDANDMVIEVIPELAGSAFEDCTVQHLLDMTAGVDFNEDYLADEGLIVEYREVSGWKPPTSKTVDGDLRSWLPVLRKKGTHGQAFHYVSPCTDLLGWVLERAGGEPFNEAFSSHLWAPMGAEFDGYITVDRLGAPRTAGGICVTLRDLARFGQMYLERGVSAGTQVVPVEWIDDTLYNYDRAAWRAGELADTLPGGGYRNKWWVTGNGHGAYTGIGVHGQWLYIDPTAETVIAVFSSQPVPADEDVFEASLTCFNTIAQAMD